MKAFSSVNLPESVVDVLVLVLLTSVCTFMAWLTGTTFEKWALIMIIAMLCEQMKQ